MYSTFQVTDPRESPQGEQRKHVTTACEDCRRARTKCDGQNPCSTCVKKSRSCTYGERPDRRQAITKRRLEDLQNDSDLLHRLLRHIQRDPDSDHLITLIRSGASLDSIRDAVENRHYQGLSLAESSTALPASETSLQRRALEISRLIDQPIFQITGAPWTSVTRDDLLVSHLITLFLTHDNDYTFCVNQLLFFKDAVDGVSGARYCSAFLFNSILAEACIYSDYPEARAQGGKASGLMMRFISEAKYELAKEAGRPSLCTMQGLLILFIAVSSANQDREGHWLLVQAIAMSQELLRKLPRSEISNGRRDEDSTYSTAVIVACWGLYHISRTAYIAWMIHYPMAIPPALDENVLLDDTLGLTDNSFIGYPYSTKPIKYNKSDIIAQWCELALIGDELCERLFDSRHISGSSEWPSLVAALLKLEVRLEDWEKNFSKTIAPPEDTVPIIVVVRIWQHFLMLIITDTIRKPPEIQLNSLLSQSVAKAKIVHLQCALRVGELCKIYAEASHGNVLSGNTTQAVLLSIYALLDNLDDEAVEPSLTNLCIHLRSLARRVPYITSIMRMLQLQVQQRQIKLPETTQRVLETFEKEDISDWTSKDLNSMYPMGWGSGLIWTDRDASPADSLPEAVTMEEFLRQFEELHTGGFGVRTNLQIDSEDTTLY